MSRDLFATFAQYVGANPVSIEELKTLSMKTKEFQYASGGVLVSELYYWSFNEKGPAEIRTDGGPKPDVVVTNYALAHEMPSKKVIENDYVAYWERNQSGRTPHRIYQGFRELHGRRNVGWNPQVSACTREWQCCV